MSKHTPAPWFISGSRTQYIEARIDGGLTQEIASVGPTASDNGYGSEQSANAYLISAAPDLLEALQRLMSNNCPLTGNPTYEQLVEHWEYEHSQDRGEAQDQLFALRAVAKALGK